MVFTKQKEQKIKQQRARMQTLESLDHVKQRAKKTGTELKKEVGTRTGTAIVTAFILVIALAWQDAIKSIVDTAIVSLNITNVETLIRITILYKIVIALLITIVCVVGIFLSSKLMGRNQQSNQKAQD